MLSPGPAVALDGPGLIVPMHAFHKEPESSAGSFVGSLGRFITN